jgi:hypothetical protein
MSDKSAEDEKPLNLDSLNFDELGRMPVMGCESDRELFVDLPHALGGLHTSGQRRSGEREFLRADFRPGP